MIILMIILAYIPICFAGVLVLNDKCLIPGTTNYDCRQVERKTQLELERSRAQAIRSRHLAIENENLDNRILQITAG